MFYIYIIETPSDNVAIFAVNCQIYFKEFKRTIVYYIYPDIYHFDCSKFPCNFDCSKFPSNFDCSKFPPNIVSLLSEEFSLAVLSEQVFWWWLLLVSFYLRMSLYHLYSWRIFLLGMESWLTVHFFHQFRIFSLIFLLLPMVSLRNPQLFKSLFLYN